MPRGRPLLAELHAHTTWSDGELTPAELIDLYGRAGFDVLAVTDHVVHSSAGTHVRAETYRAYLDELDAEAERARRRYGLLVVPGLELTVEDADPRRAGAASAVDRFELFNRDDRFDWVALRQLPWVATGDFHLREHLFTWKTLLACERNEQAVIAKLRSSAQCALMRIAADRVAA